MKLDGLKEYLLMMRKRGHTLVGVEQTAQSKCVTSYNFPLKTVLVLGWVLSFVDNKFYQDMDLIFSSSSTPLLESRIDKI